MKTPKQQARIQASECSNLGMAAQREREKEKEAERYNESKVHHKEKKVKAG
jgi:hypothetical protein